MSQTLISQLGRLPSHLLREICPQISSKSMEILRKSNELQEIFWSECVQPHCVIQSSHKKYSFEVSIETSLCQLFHPNFRYGVRIMYYVDLDSKIKHIYRITPFILAAKHGIETFHYHSATEEKGPISRSISWMNGEKDGEDIEYFKSTADKGTNGSIERIKHWSQGKLNGKDIEYLKSGEIFCCSEWIDNICVTSSCDDDRNCKIGCDSSMYCRRISCYKWDKHTQTYQLYQEY